MKKLTDKQISTIFWTMFFMALAVWIHFNVSYNFEFKFQNKISKEKDSVELIKSLNDTL